MAEQIVSDLIMKFVGDGGAIAGETRTIIDLKKSAMTSGFQKGKMFEVESFTVKTGVSSNKEDPAVAGLRGDVEDMAKQITKHVQRLAAAGKVSGLGDLGLKSTIDYAEFRNGDDNPGYPVDLKPVEFTRSVDLTSTTLMQYCINRQVFQSATLIKRKAAGSAASGEVFLRMDFDTVLIKSVNWDNDEPAKETVEFVCRAITIHYLPQLPDGTLGAAKQAFWSAAPGLTAVNLNA